ncbi:MAG: hypothetical protein Q9159_004812 [Coniocarpon cinnabarinum]
MAALRISTRYDDDHHHGPAQLLTPVSDALSLDEQSLPDPNSKEPLPRRSRRHRRPSTKAAALRVTPSSSPVPKLQDSKQSSPMIRRGPEPRSSEFFLVHVKDVALRSKYASSPPATAPPAPLTAVKEDESDLSDVNEQFLVDCEKKGVDGIISRVVQTPAARKQLLTSSLAQLAQQDPELQRALALQAYPAYNPFRYPRDTIALDAPVGRARPIPSTLIRRKTQHQLRKKAKNIPYCFRRQLPLDKISRTVMESTDTEAQKPAEVPEISMPTAPDASSQGERPSHRSTDLSQDQQATYIPEKQQSPASASVRTSNILEPPREEDVVSQLRPTHSRAATAPESTQKHQEQLIAAADVRRETLSETDVPVAGTEMPTLFSSGATTEFAAVNFMEILMNAAISHETRQPRPSANTEVRRRSNASAGASNRRVSSPERRLNERYLRRPTSQEMEAVQRARAEMNARTTTRVDGNDCLSQKLATFKDSKKEDLKDCWGFVKLWV